MTWVLAGVAVMLLLRWKRGMIVTTGEFTAPAEEYAADLSNGRGGGVELVDGQQLREIGEEIGLDNIVLMIPFCRTLAEADRVLETGGVLVDYVGDELMAMWGAPDPVEDHAERACQAAIDIMQALPELNARWQQRIAAPTTVCIGINSGMARVGNTGSKQKFKYGALGSTVNLASRVQRASKHLRTRLIISEATSRALPPCFLQRRLCQVRVRGIAAPVLLYELCDAANGGNWSGLKEGYEQALELAESGQLREAITALGNLLEEVPDDGPTLVLLSRLVDAVYSGKNRLDPVWELPGK